MTKPSLSGQARDGIETVGDATDLAQVPDSAGWVRVAGARVRWHVWGSGGPPLLLVHGGGAHSGWWFDTVKAMGPRQRVVAFDLTGHGDSDRRAEYSVRLWAEEISGVIREIVGDRAVVVAHSMGGRAAAVFAAHHPEWIRSLILMDSIIPTRPNEPMPSVAARPPYRDRAVAITRFRLRPSRGDTDPHTLRRLAEISLRPVAGGWAWKFDPNVFGMVDAALVNDSLPDIACPVTVVHAASSSHTDVGMVAALEATLGRPVAFRSLPGADHHFMVDAPRETAELLENLPETRPLGAR